MRHLTLLSQEKYWELKGPDMPCRWRNGEYSNGLRMRCALRDSLGFRKSVVSVKECNRCKLRDKKIKVEE
jgi:hypothetical protein